MGAEMNMNLAQTAMIAAIFITLTTGPADAKKNKKPGGLSAKSALQVKRLSGAWQQSQTLVKFDAPGAPADFIKAAQSNLGQPMVSDPYCLPAALVSKDTAEVRIAEAIQLGSDWTLQAIKFEKGTVKTRALTAEGQATISGKVSPILTDIIVITTGKDATLGLVATERRTTARRIGECTEDMPVIEG